MPRARTKQYDWQTYLQSQTAAAPEVKGSGCLSGFMIPPLAVILVSFMLAAFAFRQPMPAQAQDASFVVAVASLTPTHMAPPTLAPTNLADARPTAALDATKSTEPTVTPFYALTPTPPLLSTPVVVISTVGPLDTLTTVVHSTVASLDGPPSYTGELARVFRPEVLYWGDAIVRWSAEAGVDPNLAATVMQIESCGHPTAISRSGAIGLFQVMPFHFYATDNPYDPDTNALRGLQYLARSIEAAGGNPRLALAGYNGGIGVIARSEWAWSEETRRYVTFGTPIYEDASAGLEHSPMVDEWYSRYGASLCNQAREQLGMP